MALDIRHRVLHQHAPPQEPQYTLLMVGEGQKEGRILRRSGEGILGVVQDVRPCTTRAKFHKLNGGGKGDCSRIREGREEEAHASVTARVETEALASGGSSVGTPQAFSTGCGSEKHALGGPFKKKRRELQFVQRRHATPKEHPWTRQSRARVRGG